MKSTVISTLEQEGSLSEKKLRKNVQKQTENQDNFDASFEKAINSLLKRSKIELKDNKYFLIEENDQPSKKVDKKRKYEENNEEFTKSTNIEKPKKQSKLAVNSNPKAVDDVKDKKYVELWKNGEKLWRENGFDMDYLRTNPDRITRLFCGNLTKTVTEADLKSCLPGITYIKWITDKETGEFYGSTFLEMKDPEAAALAVLLDKSKFMGRPLKLYFCPPRPGDVWPPKNRNNDSKTKNEPPRREKTPKPRGCKKLYMGNLSYNIDDETIVDFFKDCGTMIGLRWLTHKGSEEFRGCGFVEFEKAEDAENAMKLDGKELLGRNIWLDWTH